MSTRAVIARKTETGFQGVYHHWDGYPSGLGKTLFALRNGHFHKDTGEMLKVLIDQHPAGWSTINGTDWTKKPGYHERRFKDSDKVPAPQCYCHGDRKEKGSVITQANASDCGCEYAYVFDGDTMLIQSSYCPSGEKMIGMFGCGDPAATWQNIAVINLNGSEPDWKVLDEAEPSKSQVTP